MRKQFLFILVLICLKATAWAATCSPNLTIDRLPVGKTFFTIVDDTNLPSLQSYNQKGEVGPVMHIFRNGKQDLAYFNKPKGQFRRGSAVGSIFLDFQREILIRNYDETNTRLLNEKYVLSRIEFNQNYPGFTEFIFTNVNRQSEQNFITLVYSRSTYDLRTKYISYGSLRYNLGPQFKLVAECGK